MIKKALFTLIYSCVFIYLNAQQPVELNKKEVTANRIEDKIIIDGNLDEAVWQTIPSYSGFIQIEPYNANQPTFDSEVKFCFNNTSFFVAIILYDDAPDSILKELGKRDNIDDLNADQVVISILPFNDGLNSYDFKLSASNVQADVKYSANGADYSWDAVWKSEISFTSDSWIAEIEIPFSAIRFPKTEVQNWGINIWRQIRRYREWSSLNYIDQKNSNSLVQCANLKGITQIKPPLRLSVFPYVSTYLEKNPNSPQMGYRFNYGTDLKYGINESFTFDATLIPDFGQVQSDDEVLNLSPFEVKYNEKRQFFTEGTELFNKADIFYSRRIGDLPKGYYAVYDSLENGEIIENNPFNTNLINASKISGRTKKGLGIGLFNAISANTFATLKDTINDIERNILSQPMTNYNILVFDQLISNNSFIGFINTNVYRKSYVANVSAADYSLSTKNNKYNTSGKVILSQIHKERNPVNLGYSYYFAGGKQTGKFTYNLTHYVASDKFDPNDLGFLRKNNEFINSLKLEYRKFDPSWKLLNWFTGLQITHTSMYLPRQFDNLFIAYNIRTTSQKHLSLGMNLSGSPINSYDYYEPRVSGYKMEIPPNFNINLWISPDYRKRVAIDVRGNYHHFNNYNINIYQINVGPRIRVNNKMLLILNSNFTLSNGDIGYVSNKTDSLGNDLIYFGKRDIKTFVNTINTSYIFNNKSYISFRLRHYWSGASYSDYYLLDKLGKLAPVDYTGNNDINFNTFTIDLLYTWHFAPGSELTVAWKNNVNDFKNYVLPRYIENLNEILSVEASNSISFKLLYYLDYNQVKKSL